MWTKRIASGEVLPAIGLGTWATFDVGASAAERAPLAAVLRGFVEAGGKLVDTSPMYGRAEAVLGDLAAKVGAPLFLATKVWTSGRERGVAQMEESFRKLRAERLDLVQVHNLVDVEVHLDTLAAWKREGRVRHVGVTHYNASALGELERVITRHDVDFVQINYSVVEPEADRRLLDVARERGLAVLANRPLAEGAAVRRLARRPLPPFAAELGATSWAQLLLKFVISHPAVTCAIPATAKPEHLIDDVRAAEGPVPDAAMRRRIAEAAR